MEPVPDIRIRVLGPVRVTDADGPLAPKQRLVLGVLALRNGAVPTDTLVDVLWPRDPPSDARSVLQVHVSRLRRAIAGTGADVRHEGGAYALDMNRSHLDLACFEQLVAEGAALVTGDPARARDLLRTALGLWNGAPVEDLTTDSPLHAEVDRLLATRLHALQKRIEADLATGHHAETIAELHQLTREHPLHEGFCCLLMTALYRAGRAGEALACFQRARETLVEEFGADPSKELQRLHERVLRQDPALDLVHDLGRVVAGGAGPSVAGPSVAVLPFDALGPLDDADVLAGALHLDVLTELARIRSLTVISRQSVLRYAGTTLPLDRIAGDLGVAHILTGTVQTVGHRFRLTVQLVDAAEGVHRWVQTYDHELTPEDLLAVQTSLARDIATSLSRELAPVPGHVQETSSMETYRLIAEGRMQFDRKTEDGLARAVESFRRVVAADPASGAGWVGLGQALAMMADYGYGDRSALLAAAESALAEAGAIAPGTADVHVCRGLVAEVRQDAPTALAEYSRASETQPGHADAASWHAWISLTVGARDQALASARRSVQLNPLSAEAVSNLSLALLAVGEPHRALGEARRAAVLAPIAAQVWGGLSTPWASMAPDAALALAQVRAGALEGARETLATIDAAAYPFEAGLVHVGLGEVDEGFALFGTCERVGFGPAMLLHHHFRDVWARVRPDPRLGDLADVVDRSWRVTPQVRGGAGKRGDSGS